jgi:hypothetical protein
MSEYRMTADEIKDFVMGWCDGKIFTDRHCHQERDITMVFMVLALGGIPEGWTEENLGLIWEWMDKAGPMAVNGMPTFFSCHMMHKEDWEICRELIQDEMKRRKDLKIQVQEKLKLRGNTDEGRNEGRDSAVSDAAKEE